MVFVTKFCNLHAIYTQNVCYSMTRNAIKCLGIFERENNQFLSLLCLWKSNNCFQIAVKFAGFIFGKLIGYIRQSLREVSQSCTKQTILAQILKISKQYNFNESSIELL